MFVKIYTRDQVPPNILTDCILDKKDGNVTYTGGFMADGKNVYIETDLKDFQIDSLKRFLINCIEL